MVENNKTFEHLCRLIGATPLSKICFEFKGEKRCIYVKQEHYNLTSSVKDRMAFHILYEAYIQGMLTQNTTIVEATSGNTGISLAAIGGALGYKVKIFMPDWMSQERVNLIKSYGAEIRLVSKEEGGFLGSIKMAEEYAQNNPNCFLPSQFSNCENVKSHYYTTGPEIWHQMEKLNAIPDGFVAGVGTGGTIMGVGKYLKEQSPRIKVFPLEPENSPTLATGHKTGKHRIEGISDEFIPEIVDLTCLDQIIDVDDGDAIIMAQKLAFQLGMGVGISSGANFIGAIKAQEILGKDAVIVTLFADDNKKYLTTDLMKEEPIKDTFLAPFVKNLKIESVVNVKDLNIQESLYCPCERKNKE